MDGSTLRPDGSENTKLYGEEVTNKQILAGDYKTPGSAEPLIAELNRYRYHRETTDVARKLDTDRRVTLSDVHFETGSAEITTDSEGALNELVSTLKAHPDWRVQVEGFTDNVGSRTSNLKLSSDRADSVINWLSDHGIDRTRLSAKGFGEARPVATNSTEEGRAKNRRVELVRV